MQGDCPGPYEEGKCLFFTRGATGYLRPERREREQSLAPIPTNVSCRDEIPAWPPMGKDCSEHLRRELIDRAEGVYQGFEAKQHVRHPLLHPYDLQHGNQCTS